jgi:hypothetical protein
MTLDEKVLEIHMMDVPDHPREAPGIERLGIPALKITNGPAGAGPGDSNTAQPATALPAALGMSASWDPQVAGHGVADRENTHQVDYSALKDRAIDSEPQGFVYAPRHGWLSCPGSHLPAPFVGAGRGMLTNTHAERARARTLIPATTSAGPAKPHRRQRKVSRSGRLALSMCPHQETGHFWDV